MSPEYIGVLGILVTIILFLLSNIIQNSRNMSKKANLLLLCCESISKNEKIIIKNLEMLNDNFMSELDYLENNYPKLITDSALEINFSPNLLSQISKLKDLTLKINETIKDRPIDDGNAEQWIRTEKYNKRLNGLFMDFLYHFRDFKSYLRNENAYIELKEFYLRLNHNQ